LIREILVRYRGRFITGFLLLLGTNALALVIPLLLRDAVEALRQTPDPGRAVRAALLVALVATLQAAARTGSRLAILGASRLAAFDLRNQFYAHLQKLPPPVYARMTTGDLMSRAVNDMMSVRSFFGPGIMNLLNTGVVYIAGLALMVWIHPGLTLAALLPLPLLYLAVQQASRRLYARSRAVQERLGEISDRVQESLSGIHLIRTYAQEDREGESFLRLCDAYRGESLALARARGALVPLMGTVGGASTLVVLWLGGKLVAEGAMTLGDFVAFTGYLAMLVWPTVAMGWVINSFQRGLVAMRRLREILDLPGEADGDRPDRSITALRGEIEFRDVTVRHPGSTAAALSRFSLSVREGETVALVGPVGSGKSTVANVLARFVPVEDGRVFVGGHDLNRIPLEVLRGALGYAPQEAFLFSRTLADNILFGRPDAGEERAHRAALDAGLRRDLAAFPQGLATRVGEGGLTLSGGQRQRSALARALVLDPRILILDDSLSSVDAETEQEILAELRGIMRGRTTIMISHRPSAVAWADRIVVLDRGRVVESGTHAELAARGGLYTRLLRRQELAGDAQEVA
jgi:ATP-binding cassette subfamily B protein